MFIRVQMPHIEFIIGIRMTYDIQLEYNFELDKTSLGLIEISTFE